MRIEKLTQYNNLNSNNFQKASQQKSYAGDGLYQIKNQSPSFGGRITNFISKLLGFREDENLSKPRKTRTKSEYERSVVKIKPSNIEPPEIMPIKEEPKIEEPKIEKPVKPILPDRYALVDEYDKRTQARVKFRNKTRGRSLTPAEKAESDRLRLEWSEIYHRLIPEHQSIVKTKTAKDFTSEADKQNYIMHYVLPRMGMSEESALDGLDMFEQFGFRADYPRKDIIIDTTMTRLSCGIYTIHKECRSD